jgi:hypothetical protein
MKTLALINSTASHFRTFFFGAFVGAIMGLAITLFMLNAVFVLPVDRTCEPKGRWENGDLVLCKTEVETLTFIETMDLFMATFNDKVRELRGKDNG